MDTPRKLNVCNSHSLLSCTWEYMRLDLKLVLPECVSPSSTGACSHTERSDHQGMLCCTMHACMHASTRFTAHPEQDLLIFVGFIKLHCWVARGSCEKKGGASVRRLIRRHWVRFETDGISPQTVQQQSVVPSARRFLFFLDSAILTRIGTTDARARLSPRRSDHNRIHRIISRPKKSSFNRSGYDCR